MTSYQLQHDVLFASPRMGEVETATEQLRYVILLWRFYHGPQDSTDAAQTFEGHRSES